MLFLRRLTIFTTIAIVTLFGAWYLITPMFNYKAPATVIATALKPSKPLGHFSLQDTNGQIFTEHALRGQWTLMFFGYMTCPDICPKTLGIMRDTWSLYSEQKPPPARFVFVNLTPLNLSELHFAQFIANYHRDFLGLSGTKEQVAQLSDQLGIFAKLQDGKLDHTSALMLIDPQGRLRAVFTPPFTPQEIARDLNLLTNYS